MKILLKYKNLVAGLAIAITALSFASCNDKDSYDVTGSTKNVVFINTQTWSPVNVNNGFLFDIEKTPIGSTIQKASKIEAKFTIQCTHPANEDITVKFEADDSAIPSGYKKLPNGVSLKMDRTELTITKGATIAKDSITVSIDTEQIGLFEAGAYMAPVKIVSSNKAELSSSYSSASLVINTVFTNIKNISLPTGTATTNKTGWVAKANGADAPVFVDGLTTSTNYFTVTSFPLTLEVDLASVQSNISGFAVRYSNQNYSSVGIAEIYTSNTSVDNYTFQGKVTYSRTQTQYASFVQAVNARYIKIVIAAPYSTTNGLRLQEFYIYQ